MNRGMIGGIAGVVIFLGAIYFAWTAYGEVKSRQRAEAVVAPWRTGAALDYGSVEAGNKTILLKDVTVTLPGGRVYAMDRITVDKMSGSPDALDALSLKIAGLRVGGASGPPFAGPLADAGVGILVLDAAYSLNWDAGKGAETRTLTVTGKRFGKLSLSLVTQGRIKGGLVGVIERMTRGTAGALTSVRADTAGVAVVSLDGSFAGKPLYDAIVAAKAKGGKKEDAEQAFRKAIDVARRRASNDIAETGLTAILSATRRDGVLDVTAKPDKPVALGALIPVFYLSGGEAKRMLDLKIIAKSK